MMSRDGRDQSNHNQGGTGRRGKIKEERKLCGGLGVLDPVGALAF